MKRNVFRRFLAWTAIATAMFTAAPGVTAADVDSRTGSASVRGDAGRASQEPINAGWQLYADNDLFTGSGQDRDYTGGIALTLNGRQAKDNPFSINRWLSAADSLSGFAKLHAQATAFTAYSQEFGITVFTPSDVETPDPIDNDHPYANLLFLANSRQTILPDDGLAYQSAFTFGFLGLPTGEWVQRGIHELVGGSRPQGWDNQISNGGEPTFRYSAGVQKSLLSTRSPSFGFDLLGAAEANLGFSTDVGATLSFRWGRLNTPWWAFTPHQSDYINLGGTQTSIARRGRTPELFLWGGINAKYRFYNAVLQGQFRDSAVKFDAGELNPIVLEGWLGVTLKRFSHWGLSLAIRARTREIDEFDGDAPLWGGIILSHTGRER